MDQVPARQKPLRALLAFALGALLGFLAKFFDTAPVIGAIGTSIGIWVLAATVLAAWSRSPGAAALHVFLFFTALLVAYYTYSMVLFGFFPRYYFLAWGAIALLSPVGGMIAWYARGNGWIAATCAALPVALLLLEGYPFLYTGSIPLGFDLLAAVLLVALLNRKNSQRARILAVTLVAFLIGWRLDLIPRLFGWI